MENLGYFALRRQETHLQPAERFTIRD
jgi:hypothetical protein